MAKTPGNRPTDTAAALLPAAAGSDAPMADPPVHYSPPAKLAGDTVIACNRRHWALVSENPAMVTCQPCQDPVMQALANARAARNKTSANNPLNPHVDRLLNLATRMLGLATGWEAEVPGLEYRAERAAGPLQGTVLSTRAQELTDHAAEIRDAAAAALADMEARPVNRLTSTTG